MITNQIGGDSSLSQSYWRSTVVFFILLSGFTLVTGLWVDRYQDISPELLVNPDFNAGLVGWTVTGAVTVGGEGSLPLTLVGGGPGVSTAVSQRIEKPARFKMLRLRGDLACEDLVPGDKPWHIGRLVLGHYKHNDKWIPGPHVVGQVRGTQDYHSYSDIFAISAKAQYLKVIVQFNHATGILYGARLSLKEVQEYEWYPFLRYGCLFLWAVFVLFFLCSPYFSKQKSTQGIRFAVPLLMLVIIAGTSLPGSIKADWNVKIDQRIHTIEAAFREHPKIQRVLDSRFFVTICKSCPTKSTVAHFMLFASVAFGLGLRCQREDWIRVGLDIFMLATASELIQFYIEDRTPYWTDFSLDIWGAGVGVLLVIAFRKGQELNRSRP